MIALNLISAKIPPQTLLGDLTTPQTLWLKFKDTTFKEKKKGRERRMKKKIKKEGKNRKMETDEMGGGAPRHIFGYATENHK